MAAIILTILKVIGIVLLAVTALALVLILLILYVPIRYRIRAQKNDPDNGDDILFRINVTYLLHLLSGGFVYEDNAADKFAKVLGIKIWPKKEREEETPDPADTEVSDTNTDNTSWYEEESSDNITYDMTEDITGDITEDTPSDSTEETIEHTVDDLGEQTSDKPSVADRIADLYEKLSDKYESASDKVEHLRKELHFWDRMIHDERNRNAYEHTKTVVIRFLKKIAPRRIKGYVHFGFDDPATTGKVLAYLGIIYPVLPKKLLIDPSFEDTLIYGDVDIKGRLALASVAYAFLKLYFNKDCKRCYRIYKKHKNKG